MHYPEQIQYQQESVKMSEIKFQDNARLAFLSDIHGNSPALRSVLEDIQHERCTALFMLGDIINGVDPDGCVHLLRSWSIENGVGLFCIKGNAEAYLTTPDRDFLMKHIDTYHVDILKDMQWYQDRLSGSNLDWIYSLADTLRWYNSYLVHDSPADRKAVQAQTDIPASYRELHFHGRGISPDMAESDWAALFEYMRTEGLHRLFCGHTHVPFYRESAGLVVCNVGSAGMPLDGDPRPSWVMIDDNEHGIQPVSIHRVDYDISAAMHLIDRAGDYPNFQRTGFQEAYKKMFLQGLHWREFMPNIE